MHTVCSLNIVYKGMHPDTPKWLLFRPLCITFLTLLPSCCGQLGSENLYPDLLWQGRGDVAPPLNAGRPDEGKLPGPLKQACDKSQSSKTALDPDDGDKIDDNHAFEGCLRSLCEPICLRQTIQCSISGSFLMNEFGGHYSGKLKSIDHLSNAICGQLQAYMCSELIPVCPATNGDNAGDADWLYRWTEARAYGGYESPAFPVKTCEHDMKQEDLCSSCGSGVKIKVEIIREDPWINHPSLLRSGKPYEKNQSPPLESFFTGAGVTPDQQVPKHRSQSYRWAVIRDLVKAKLSDLSKLASKMLCYCLGCCDPPDGKQSCFYPITQEIFNIGDVNAISWSSPKSKLP